MRAIMPKKQVREVMIAAFGSLDTAFEACDAPATEEDISVFRLLAAIECSLQYLTEVASQTSTQKESCQAIVEAIPLVTHFDAATISFLDQSNKSFTIEAHCNLPLGWIREVFSNDMRISTPEIYGHFLDSDDPLFYEDFDNHPVSKTPRKRSGSQGMAITRLRLSDRNWGLLTFQTRRRGDWREEERALVGILGMHIELLLKTAQNLRQQKWLLVQQNTFLKRSLRSELLAVINNALPDAGQGTKKRIPLSPREEKALALIAKGYTNPEIADELDITLSTTKKHVRSLLDKLHLQNRAQAAAYAQKLLSDSEVLPD